MRKAKTDAVEQGDVAVMKEILWDRHAQVQVTESTQAKEQGPASSARDMNYNNDEEDGGQYDDDGYDYTNYEGTHTHTVSLYLSIYLSLLPLPISFPSG